MPGNTEPSLPHAEKWPSDARTQALVGGGLLGFRVLSYVLELTSGASGGFLERFAGIPGGGLELRSCFLASLTGLVGFPIFLARVGALRGDDISGVISTFFGCRLRGGLLFRVDPVSRSAPRGVIARQEGDGEKEIPECSR